MKTTARLERPEYVEVTITTTMPLAAWKLIRRDLVARGGDMSTPSREFAQSIVELIARSEQTLLGVEPDVQEGSTTLLQKQIDAENIKPLIDQTMAPPRRRPSAAGAQA